MSSAPPNSVSSDFYAAMAAHEIELIREALEAARHNQRKAAEYLGLSYHQFRGLYRKYQSALDR